MEIFTNPSTWYMIAIAVGIIVAVWVNERV